MMNNSGKADHLEQPAARSEDRRIQRTRQAIQRAFKEVIREKGFAATTVQDITERANVNRGTFYIHFADKFALTSSIIRQNFRSQLQSSLPPDPGWNKPSLESLVRMVLLHFEGKYHHRHASINVPTSLFEQAVREELDTLLLCWLRQSRPTLPGQPAENLERLVQVVCWSIFGTAVQWGQEETAFSVEEMTAAIMRVILEGLPG